jgi:hypothetical protein
MNPSAWTSYALLTVAAIALVAAMWFAVRHPASQSRRRPAWQATQACLAGLAASTAAVCVLAALALLD